MNLILGVISLGAVAFLVYFFRALRRDLNTLSRGRRNVSFVGSEDATLRTSLEVLDRKARLRQSRGATRTQVVMIGNDGGLPDNAAT